MLCVVGFKLVEWWYGSAEEKVAGSLALPVPPMLKKLAELGQTKTGLPLPMVLQATSGSSTTVKAYDLKASSSS